MTTPSEDRPPVVFRLPRWQPALLFVVTSGLAAWAIYMSSSSFVVAIVVVLAVAFFVSAVAAARMYLVADDDGIGIRRFAGENSLTWDQISSIGVTKVRSGALTLELQTAEHTALRVPPSLVLPLRPTNIAKTTTLLGVKAHQLRERRPHGSVPPVRPL